MSCEINDDFYCTTGYRRTNGEKCYGAQNGICRILGGGCLACHRKHPTPEQYKEDYGMDYPDDGAVYFRVWQDNSFTEWEVHFWRDVQSDYAQNKETYIDAEVVCACTPFGKPEKDWGSK